MASMRRTTPSFARCIRPAVDAELATATRLERAGDTARAFRHLERAHVLGQRSTALHVLAHARMLGWAWRRRDARELAGQLLRLAGAASKTALGLVPAGNTGGSDVPPLRRLPIPPDLQRAIDAARPRRGRGVRAR